MRRKFLGLKEGRLYTDEESMQFIQEPGSLEEEDAQKTPRAYKAHGQKKNRAKKGMSEAEKQACIISLSRFGLFFLGSWIDIVRCVRLRDCELRYNAMALGLERVLPMMVVALNEGGPIPLDPDALFVVAYHYIPLRDRTFEAVPL